MAAPFAYDDWTAFSLTSLQRIATGCKPELTSGYFADSGVKKID
jgi:hypothetical protein